MEENFKSTLQDIFEVTLTANRDAELMLNSGLSFAGWHVAEKLGIPALAFAVGIYLPIETMAPLFVGGLIRWSVERSSRHDKEILVQRRALATDWKYSINSGFSFSFGSIYNNVVNNRFF